MIQLRLCDCGTETVYARCMGAKCYKAWWRENKAVVVHGTKARGANYGCRCDACTEANAKASKAYRDKKASA